MPRGHDVTNSDGTGPNSIERLATRTVVQPLSRRIWRLVENVQNGRCQVLDSMYAQNALHLLRDALLDAEGVAGLLTCAVERRLDLQEQQVEAMTFHGPLHEDYHDAARQVRAAVGAGISQSKRLLNQTADVVAAFIAHGANLRSKSFGSQVGSAQSAQPTGDGRTDALIALLKEDGSKLDTETFFRDKFLEHVHAQRGSQQPRPSSGHTALRFGVGEPGDDMAVEDIVEANFNWVRFKNQTNEFFVVHVLPVSHTPDKIETIILDRRRLDGHFRSHDPHKHVFTVDSTDDGSAQSQYNVAAMADLASTQGPVLAYIDQMLTICSA